MRINWLKKFFNKNQHDAFTDLNRVDNRLLVCFRRATDHHSSDGRIVLQQLNLQGRFISQSIFNILNSDLRDPKIYVLHDKSLILTAYARIKQGDNEGNERTISQNTYWHDANSNSVDSINWQHQGFFAEPFHWCWRLSWHKQHVYSLAYERKTENLYLYHGANLSKLTAFEHPVLSKAEHGVGYPNESDLCFTNNNSHTQATAIVRRDADTFTTKLGKSVAPFEMWQWQDLPIYLASPRIVAINNDDFIIAARYEHGALTQLSPRHEQTLDYYGCGNERRNYIDDELKTGLFALNSKTEQLSFLLALPSADDNGYPGVVLDDTNLDGVRGLWISYYSTPEKGKTQVYLAYVDNIQRSTELPSVLCQNRLRDNGS